MSGHYLFKETIAYDFPKPDRHWGIDYDDWGSSNWVTVEGNPLKWGAALLQSRNTEVRPRGGKVESVKVNPGGRSEVNPKLERRKVNSSVYTEIRQNWEGINCWCTFRWSVFIWSNLFLLGEQFYSNILYLCVRDLTLCVGCGSSTLTSRRLWLGTWFCVGPAPDFESSCPSRDRLLQSLRLIAFGCLADSSWLNFRCAARKGSFDLKLKSLY